MQQGTYPDQTPGSFPSPATYESTSVNYIQPTYVPIYEQANQTDNILMHQRGLPMQTISFSPNKAPMSVYQTAPPPYATVVQPVSQNVNPNVVPMNKPAKKIPFSQGFKWPRRSVQLVCPNCGATVTTRVKISITPITVIATILLCFCICIFAIIVMCLPPCKKATHYCPYCNCMLGVRRELR